MECPTPRKLRYFTRKHAKAEMRAYRAKGLNVDGQQAYLCPCGYFHLGHKAGKFTGELRSRSEHRYEQARLHA